MKLTEAKEWIDRLVKTGMNRDAATVFVKEAGEIPEEIANGVLGMVYGARAATIPTNTEPPPVEIPRRIALTVGAAPSRVATVDATEISRRNDGGIHCYLDDDQRRHLVWPGQFIELHLTKTEQARLLLEKLSREDQTEIDRSDGCVLVFDRNGCWRAVDPKKVPHGTPFFKSHRSFTNARDTIIRTGLAWWEEGE